VNYGHLFDPFVIDKNVFTVQTCK